MYNPPKTLEEARKVRYGDWSGNPKGVPYQEGRCAYEVYPQFGWIPGQCRNKNGKGINGLYCGIHARIVK